MVNPVRITIYNHKGGVGKTTLAVNIAFALSSMGKSVLLIDSDPQCNLTSYLLSDDVVDELLNNSNNQRGQTIWSAVKPVIDSTGSVHLVKLTNIGDILLLPGDIRLSEFEEFLGDAWADGFKRRIGALRATSSISYLITNLCKEHGFDFVFFDTGPNIGPLNRVLLLDSDFFIVPVACDLFSTRALTTLGQAVKKWIIDAKTINAIAPDDSMLLKGRPDFLGYIPQGFRVYGQNMTRAANSYFREIKSRVYDDVSSVLREIDAELAPKRSIDPMIGKVQDLGSLVQTAQREGVSIWDCSDGNQSLKKKAKKSFSEIAKKIILEINDRRNINVV